MKKQFTLLSILGISILLMTGCHIRERSSSSDSGDSSSSFSSSQESSSSPKTFTVTWKNENGLVLELDQDVLEGSLPTYEGQTPTKPNDAQYNYVFKGWYPEISAVTSDITYTATYQEELRKYTVTWLDEDGTILETDNNVPYGTTPEYNDATPSKESTVEHTYTFAGWDKEIVDVTGDVSYQATYQEEARKYVITWLDEDGTSLKSEEVAYGEVPSYGENNPTKESTNTHTYTFNGWSPNVTSVNGDATYTATYLEQVRTYTVTWLNYDGTVLEVDNGLEYGTTPSFNGEQPTRANIRGVNYSFKGWSPEISVVESDQTYVATYDYDAYFSFALLNYELEDGYTLSDLRGAPWINTNLEGEINKIKKPSLKDDFYTAVNYDSIKNGELGPFEVDYVYAREAMDAIFNDEAETTNGTFISALTQKLINGSTAAISDYLINLDIENYLCSKEVFNTSSSYFQISYSDEYGYILEYNDGYLEESLGLHTLWFYSQFEDYSFFEAPADNIANTLASILGYSLSTSELEAVKSMERDLTYTSYYNYYTYFDEMETYTVASMPWEALSYALEDLGLSLDDTVSIKKYYINPLNSLFNDYLANDPDMIKKDILTRLSFDYRFLLGGTNYKRVNPYIVNAYVFDSEKYLGYYDGEVLAKEFCKLLVPILIEQSYIQLAGDEEIKDTVSELIEDVVSGYHDMLNDNDWLSRTTRGNILRKLEMMAYASCYSDVYKDFAKIDDTNLNGASAFELYNRYTATIINSAINKIAEDEQAWVWDTMPSYTVNAFYMPTYNSFVILNGIVPGFISDSLEETYGMLGFVIGHEITHAFDSNGSLYDENGENNDLMTSSDRSTFDKKVRKLINFYDNINLFDTTYVDGDNVDGEAIADMGGIKVMLQLAKNIPDFDYDIFFRAAARTWCEQPYDDSYAQMVIQDSHPFNYLRTNITLAQFDEFVETYNIGPGDGMYIPESQRVKIW